MARQRSIQPGTREDRRLAGCFRRRCRTKGTPWRWSALHANLLIIAIERSLPLSFDRRRFPVDVPGEGEAQNGTQWAKKECSYADTDDVCNEPCHGVSFSRGACVAALTFHWSNLALRVSAMVCQRQASSSASRRLFSVSVSLFAKVSYLA